MLTAIIADKQPDVVIEPPPAVADAAGAAPVLSQRLRMDLYHAGVFALTDRCGLGQLDKTGAAFEEARVNAQLELAKKRSEQSEARRDTINASAARIPMPGGAPLGVVDLVHGAADWAEGNKLEALVVGATGGAASKAARLKRIKKIREGYLDIIPHPNPKYWRNILLNSAVVRAKELGITLENLTVNGFKHLHIGRFSVEGENPMDLAELWAKTMKQLGITEVSFAETALPKSLKEVGLVIERLLQRASAVE